MVKNDKKSKSKPTTLITDIEMTKIISDKRYKTTAEKHSKNLCIKLTESEYNALRAIKKYHSKTYSDMIRDSILFLNNYYNN
jgi:hypothetical protein